MSKPTFQVLSDTKLYTNSLTPLKVSANFSVEYSSNYFVWNFGDGHTATGESVEHVYEEVGTFNVTLTRYNSSGEPFVSDPVAITTSNLIPNLMQWDKTSYNGGSVIASTKSNSPFKVNVFNSWQQYDESSFLSFYVENSKSIPFDQSDKQMHLKPNWRFLDVNDNVVSNVKLNQQKIYAYILGGELYLTTSSSGTVFVGVSSQAEFYFIDDTPSGIRPDEDYLPSTIIVSQSLSSVYGDSKFTNEEYIQYPSIIKSVFIDNIVPSYLEITSNGVFDINPIAFQKTKIPYNIRLVDSNGNFIKTNPIISDVVSSYPLEIGINGESISFTDYFFSGKAINPFNPDFSQLGGFFESYFSSDSETVSTITLTASTKIDYTLNRQLTRYGAFADENSNNIYRATYIQDFDAGYVKQLSDVGIAESEGLFSNKFSTAIDPFYTAIYTDSDDSIVEFYNTSMDLAETQTLSTYTGQSISKVELSKENKRIYTSYGTNGLIVSDDNETVFIPLSTEPLSSPSLFTSELPPSGLLGETFLQSGSGTEYAFEVRDTDFGTVGHRNTKFLLNKQVIDSDWIVFYSLISNTSIYTYNAVTDTYTQAELPPQYQLTMEFSPDLPLQSGKLLPILYTNGLCIYYTGGQPFLVYDVTTNTFSTSDVNVSIPSDISYFFKYDDNIVFVSGGVVYKYSYLDGSVTTQAIPSFGNSLYDFDDLELVDNYLIIFPSTGNNAFLVYDIDTGEEKISPTITTIRHDHSVAVNDEYLVIARQIALGYTSEDPNIWEYASYNPSTNVVVHSSNSISYFGSSSYGLMLPITNKNTGESLVIYTYGVWSGSENDLIVTFNPSTGQTYSIGYQDIGLERSLNSIGFRGVETTYSYYNYIDDDGVILYFDNGYSSGEYRPWLLDFFNNVFTKIYPEPANGILSESLTGTRGFSRESAKVGDWIFFSAGMSGSGSDRVNAYNPDLNIVMNGGRWYFFESTGDGEIAEVSGVENSGEWFVLNLGNGVESFRLSSSEGNIPEAQDPQYYAFNTDMLSNDNQCYISFFSVFSNKVGKYNINLETKTVNLLDEISLGTGVPVDMISDRDGANLYVLVTDYYNRESSINHYTTDTNTLISSYPIGYDANFITLDTDQNPWAAAKETAGADTYLNVSKLNGGSIEKTPLSTFGGDFYHIGGITGDSYGNVWILDSHNDRIVVFDKINNSSWSEVPITEDELISNNQYIAYGDWNGFRWYNKFGSDGTVITYELTGESSPFKIYPRGKYNLQKINEDHDAIGSLESYRTTETMLNSDTLFNFLGSIYGNNLDDGTYIGKNIFEKIANFTMNHSDIETCNIDALASFCDETGIEFQDRISFPRDVKRMVELFSIKFKKLWGEDYKTGFIEDYVGEQLDVSTYIISADPQIKLIAKEKFNNQYTIITPMIMDSVTHELSSDKTYPLSSFSNDWGWGLSVPENGKLDRYYEFYSLNPVENTRLIDIIDWDNVLTDQDIKDIQNFSNYMTRDGIVSVALGDKLRQGLGLFSE